jgi:hypothetical protein
MTVICVESARVPAPGPARSGYIVLRGQSYPDDHPAVLAQPHLFVDPDVFTHVEEATQNPGETRKVRRG